MSTKTTVPLASANIVFLWKMKQLAVIDMAETSDHKVKAVYVLRRDTGATTNVKVWVDADATGKKRLNVDVTGDPPEAYEHQQYEFDNDECSIWLDKASATGQTNQLVIGTGDIRGIAVTGNDDMEIIPFNLDIEPANAVIIQCDNDYLLTFYVPSLPASVPVSGVDVI